MRSALRSLVLLFATASAAFAQSVAPVIQTASSPRITLASTTTRPAAKQQHALPVQPNRPKTDQDVLLLFAGRSANDKVLLMLNNNRPDKLTADLTIYDLSGNPRTLPSLELDAAESRLLDFGGVLRSLNIMAPLGFLKVHYMGLSMELGSQLTLYPVEDRGGLDSPRSLSVDYVSTERHAVAWTPPGASTTFSITNVAPSPIQAEMTVNGKPETLLLQPNETAVRTRDAVEEVASPLVDLDVNFTGPNDALRVFGFVASKNDGTLPIRTYDPKGATSSVLSAVGLTTADETHASVRNLTAAPIVVTPTLTPVGTDQTKSINSVPVLIPAHTSLELPLKAYLAALSTEGVTRATLFLKNDAPAGALVAALDQRVTPNLLQDIPFKTANPSRYMRGAYPLRWEKDYTNAPMIANTSSQQATVRAYVIAGGITYTFSDTAIAPGATASFDVDTIRAKQTPDSTGKKIPSTALFGKFHWTPVPSKISQTGLHGRTELQSLQTLRASSFSCGMNCPYEENWYPYFDSGDPWGNYPTPDLQDSRELTMHDYFVDTYGNPSSHAVNTNALYPYGTNDSSILSTAEINNQFTLRMDTGHIGSTYFYYYFTKNDTYISSTDDGNPDTCTVEDDGGNEGGDASVGAYPTNFIENEWNATSGGILHFEYVWQSSTGNLADLSQCNVREVVTYPGTPGGSYTWRTPPYAPRTDATTTINTPYISGNIGMAIDNHGNSGFQKPYRADNFSASQRYEYSCPSNGGAWVPLVTGLTINRNVSQNDDSSWEYVITKADGRASVNPLP